LEVIGILSCSPACGDEFAGARVIALPVRTARARYRDGRRDAAHRQDEDAGGRKHWSPILEALSDIEPDAGGAGCVVLELSVFQLETTDSLNVDAAVVLNLSEDTWTAIAGMRE